LDPGGDKLWKGSLSAPIQSFGGLRQEVMKTPTKHKKATPTGVDTITKQLAQSWLAWIKGGSVQQTAALGQAVDQLLRRQLPNNVLTGALQGLESDIRQYAAELLFGRLLAGNIDLAKATAAGDVARIAQQIMRSTCAAAKFGRNRFIRRTTCETKRRELLVQAVEDGVLIQAQQHRPGLPQETKVKLALAGLALGVRSGQISDTSAEMVRAVINGDKRQEELAAEQGVSPSAVSQRLKRTAKALSTIITQEEVDL
jgi:hypothetical protein